MENRKDTPRTTDDSAQSSNKESVRDRVGSVIEKVGHKVSDAGAPGLGQKIHDLGDKIEKEHSNPSHPHRA